MRAGSRDRATAGARLTRLLLRSAPVEESVFSPAQRGLAALQLRVIVRTEYQNSLFVRCGPRNEEARAMMDTTETPVMPARRENRDDATRQARHRWGPHPNKLLSRSAGAVSGVGAQRRCG